MVIPIRGQSCESLRHRPIDAFMASHSRDLGPRAIGVFLSGAGSDGTWGFQSGHPLVAVKLEPLRDWRP